MEPIFKEPVELEIDGANGVDVCRKLMVHHMAGIDPAKVLPLVDELTVSFFPHN